MLPVVEAFKEKFHLEQLLIIADAGLLSNSNMELLLEKKYEFILGGRLKNESNTIKERILGQEFRDGQSIVLQRDAHTRLIVNYAVSRAKKDASNRIRGINKLEKAIATGKLNKAHINNRGYNKYLPLEGEVTISIDYEKFRADGCWDGLKGYVTNSPLSKESIIENYKHLWQIEKAFRISKTDLRIRPVYHRLPGRISAHIIIAFAAYKLYKELERQLKLTQSYLSVEKAIELMKTIYRIKVQLPESKQEKNLIFAPDLAQKHLLSVFNVKTISD